MPTPHIPLPDLECPSFAALMLAGGTTPADLASKGASQMALLPLVGHPLATYSLSALRRAESVDSITLIGDPALQPLCDEYGARLLPSGGPGMIDNLMRGLESLKDQPWVLLMGCDSPLLTAPILESLIEMCRKEEADLYYPIIPRDLLETKYPGGKRTWINMREGTFTGGNVFVVRPEPILQNRPLFDRLIAARKDPLKLISMMGFGFVIKMLTGTFALGGLEKRAQEILGVAVKALVVPHPEIGIDLDKGRDYEQLTQILTEKQERKSGFFAPLEGV